MNTRRILLSLSTLGLAMLSSVGASATAAGSTAYTPSTASQSRTGVVTEDPATPGKLLLMLDASGSMNEPDPSGLTKMEAAKKGLNAVVDKLPDTAQVGLRVYGATVMGGTPTPEACADTQLVSPIKALDRAGLKAAINGFVAKGETPIAGSLTEAIKDLGTEGKRNIVLVSDGEESCVPDPCPVIQNLIGSGVDLQIDTVGYAVGDKARAQLQCIADAGHGTYYDAANADQIASSITRLSQRAMRPFALTGKPITGIDLQDGQQPPTALPELSPGQFLDTMNTGKHWRSYTVKRTIPGSTLHVSFTTRPTELVGTLESGDRTARAMASSGKECSESYASESGGLGTREATSATVQILGDTDPSETDRKSSVCETDTSFTVQVTRSATTTTTPVEILVIEEPPVTNLADLPEPKDTARDPELITHGTPKEAIGGLAFSDATEITAGTWQDTLVPGELLVYKVRVEDGQKATLQVKGPVDFTFPEQGTALWISGHLIAPDRLRAGNDFQSVPSFSRTYGFDKESVTTGTVTYRNRYAAQSGRPTYMRAASMGGWYYVSIGVGLKDVGTIVKGQPIKVAFTVQVDGQPSNAVKYVTGSATVAASPSAPASSPSATASAAPATRSSDSGSVLPWVGGGLLTLAVLAGLAYAVARRRGQGASQA